MNYSWYEIVSNGESITQGDIIPKCNIVELVSTKEAPFIKANSIAVDVIVMTQACDLEHSKVKQVTLCRLSPLKDIIKRLLLKEFPEGQNHENILNGNIIGKVARKRREIIQDLKKGAYLDFHLLNKYENNQGLKELDYMVVILKESFVLPIDFIHNNLRAKEYKLFRLLPPYREHLSQAYARNFFRIGLPLDINIQEEELQ
ncbi:hypothetical protein US8_01494 [Bacillus altitudinis]|uniref:hypothetical protein n=1 Tax=Bacillus altitudinis TaxID=293387 RepID=UPI000D7BFBA0|nr:hypothetical protein [Bacillus altitudinis]PYH23809.1 hypothetical protein US8_01494 [Bacillus altitudinis]